MRWFNSLSKPCAGLLCRWRVEPCKPATSLAAGTVLSHGVFTPYVGNLIEVKAKGIFEAVAQVLARVVKAVDDGDNTLNG